MWYGMHGGGCVEGNWRVGEGGGSVIKCVWYDNFAAKGLPHSPFTLPIRLDSSRKGTFAPHKEKAGEGNGTECYKIKDE